MPDYIYTQKQIEEVAKKSAEYAVKQALQSLNLDNEIQQDVIASLGEVNMASNYKERYYYTDNHGQIESKVFYGSNKKQTDLKFKMFLEEERSKQMHAPTLSEFVDNIYKKTFLDRLAPTTRANYASYLDRYIIPALGNKHMDLITVVDVQNFYDWMANKKQLVSDTISRVSGLLGRLFRIAIDMKLVSDSPIKKTLLLNNGKQSKHHKALLDENVQRVKNAIPYLKNEQQRLYMALLAYTGMRREEIVGLGWEHLNFAEAYGHIQRTVTYPNNQKAVIRNQTKTKYSTRDFVIPDQLMDILKPCAKKSGYIIHGKDPSSPIPASSLQRLYRNAFTALGISDYNNHDWRTTFGTQLKEFGLTSPQVADLMGHADTRMVERVYAPTRHESIMKHKNAINKLNQTS